MKPTFALDLSRDQIALLHRTPKGWLSIGEVAFDAPDLDAALAYLRTTALGLSPLGMATKIILPASQVLYTEVYAPGPSRDEKRRQIATALEGRTPYAVEDLVFDWSGKGATVKVAVAARETLDEAEGFAVTHRMNPISTVAVPEDGTFVGEPWFGPTAASAAALGEDDTVERDRDAVVFLQREVPAAPSEPETDVATSPAPDTIPETDAAPPQALTATDAAADAGDDAGDDAGADADAGDDALPGLEAALNGDLPAAADAAAGQMAVSADPATSDPATSDLAPSGKMEAPPEPSFAAVFAAAGADPSDPDTDALEQSLSAALADVPDTSVAAPLARPTAAAPMAEVPPAEADEAPFAHVTDTSAFPDAEDEEAPAAAARSTSGADASRPAKTGVADRDDIPAAPSSAAMVAFASRRSAGGSGMAPPVDAATRPVGPMSSGSMSGGASKPVTPPGLATRVPPAKGFAGLVTAPSIPGTRAKPKIKPPAAEAGRPAGQAASSVRSPARPGGTFGTSAPPRNRSGVVFMVLVALLLLGLALIAAWSSFYLARNTGDGLPQTEVAVGATEVIEVVPGLGAPGIEDEMLADLQDPEGQTGPLPEAEGASLAGGDAGALATESTDLTQLDADPAPMNLAPQAATDLPEGTLAPDADTIADTAADTATDLVAETPVVVETAPPVEPAPATAVTTDLAVAAPPVEDQDEIFLSAMDAPPPALDALALPVPVFVADAAPDAPMPPPAFGTVYQFDARGLLMPTPEGILSPEGVLLFAGPPPLVPPARSEVAAAAAAARALEAVPVAAVPPAPGATAADASLVTGGAGAETPVVGSAADPALTLAPADPAMAGFRPRARPAGLAPDAGAAPDANAAAEDDASLTPESSLTPEADSAVANLRPLPRPATVLAAASASRPAADAAALAPADLGAQGASLAAQAEARLAAAAALEAENPSIVAISMRPAARPGDLSRAVEAAVAAAVRAPEPEAEVIETAAAPPPDVKPEELEGLDEPEVASAAPSIPSKASVAKQATFANAINLSKINLIGTYGTDSRRYALIRQSNGRYKKVKVGDKIDGGTIKAITETEVRYQKGGKLIALAMPKA